MASDTLTPGNEAGTCGVATARSGRRSATPSDARSSFAARPGSKGRADGAGSWCVAVSGNPAKRWTARKPDPGAAAPTPTEDEILCGGGGVSPPSWHHLTDNEAEPEQLNAPAIATGSDALPTRGADKKREARARKRELFEGYPPGTTQAQTRLLACRVDALAVAYRLELSSAFVDELLERQSLADLAGSAELTLLGGIAVALTRSRRHDFFSFQNADVRGAIDLRAPGGWTLEVVVRATSLATHPLAEALALAERVASGFGEPLEQRLRRFDLAADFVGWPLRRDDAERFSTRAGKSGFLVDSKDVDEAETAHVKPRIREFTRNGVGVTGLAFASGNDLSAHLRQEFRARLGWSRSEACDRTRALAPERLAWRGRDAARISASRNVPR